MSNKPQVDVNLVIDNLLTHIAQLSKELAIVKAQLQTDTKNTE